MVLLYGYDEVVMIQLVNENLWISQLIQQVFLDSIGKYVRFGGILGFQYMFKNFMDCKGREEGRCYLGFDFRYFILFSQEQFKMVCSYLREIQFG